MNESINYNQKISALIITFLLGLLSCNITLPSSQEDGDSSAVAVSESKDLLGDTACYLSVNGKDSIFLTLRTQGDALDGELRFDNFQIDGSQGTVKGVQRGDTLWLTYDFMAEGTHNITEEVFLMHDGELIRGQGERMESDGVYKYVNSEEISFEDGQIFHLTSCK